MIDFYESAVCLNISSNNDIGLRGWQACGRTLKKVVGNYYLKLCGFGLKMWFFLQSKCLEELEAKNTILSESSMLTLGRSLKFSQLCILKLENCNLSDRTLTSLGNYF